MTRMADDPDPDNPQPSPGDGRVLSFPSTRVVHGTSNEELFQAADRLIRGPLIRYAAYYVGAEADDLVQEAFIELWYRYVAESRTSRIPLETLLFQSVYLRLLDYRRTRRRRKLLLALGGYAYSLKSAVRRWMEPDGEVANDGLYAKAIGRGEKLMSDRARDVHTMHYKAGFSVQQIIDMTGLSRSSVRTLLHRGNLLMQEHVDRAGYTRDVRRRTVEAGEGQS